MKAKINQGVIPIYIKQSERFVLIDCWTQSHDRKIFNSLKEVPSKIKLKKEVVDNILNNSGSMIVNGRFILMSYWAFKKLSRVKLRLLVTCQFMKTNMRDDIIFLLKGGPKTMTMNYVRQFYPDENELDLERILAECKKKHRSYSNPVW